jgi:hypothetical protein
VPPHAPQDLGSVTFIVRLIATCWGLGSKAGRAEGEEMVAVLLVALCAILLALCAILLARCITLLAVVVAHETQVHLLGRVRDD